MVNLFVAMCSVFINCITQLMKKEKNCMITTNFGNLYPDLKFEVQVPETSKLFQLFLARSSCMMDGINETD